MGRPSDLVLGLDGGGTKTLLAVADRDGAVHRIVRSRTLDPFAVPAWPEGLADALAEVEPFRDRLAASVLGLPCFGEVPAVSARQLEVARRLVPAPIDVINDVEAAFDGALAGAPGVLLLAGTGSMAWAGDGQRALRCGGWGDFLGDEGSANWIGREALGEATRAIDGRSPHAAFAERLLARIGVGPEALLAWCLDLPMRRTAIAALAIDVDTLAEMGDPAALSILLRAADAIAVHANACARRLALPSDFAWSYGGSVFNSRTVMARVTERLGGAPRLPRMPPLGGALWRAARNAGWPINDIWIERLGRSLANANCSADAA